MSSSISFRLSDQDVAVLDLLIDQGAAKDRSASLRVLLAREGRRQQALADAHIYAEHGRDLDLDAMVEWGHNHLPTVD